MHNHKMHPYELSLFWEPLFQKEKIFVRNDILQMHFHQFHYLLVILLISDQIQNNQQMHDPELLQYRNLKQEQGSP